MGHNFIEFNQWKVCPGCEERGVWIAYYLHSGEMLVGHSLPRVWKGMQYLEHTHYCYIVDGVYLGWYDGGVRH